MTGDISPALILIVGALLVPLLRGTLRGAYMLALPVVALWILAGLPYGNHGEIQLLDMTLTTLRVDKLSFVFGTIFLIAAILGTVYALHVDDTVQHVAGLIYAGSAVGAVFAGDLITLFVYWEGTAIASVFLIWARRSERSFQAGLRYLIVQVGSGVFLLAGIIIHYAQTNSIAFDQIGTSTFAGMLIFLAIGIKCAFPLLHGWMQDAYPEATVTGTVVLSVFTTKLAVYALARGYAGTEWLVPIGATMAVFPLYYALVSDDLRRVLTYSLNSQLGFMVVGVGIGTEMAINGTVAHAFASILYMALLFMALGAVLYRGGSANASDLGGLYKSMPWTAGFCIVGAASISAFPLFSGFVTKTLILMAAMQGGYFWTWLILLGASAAAFLHTGIRVPYLAFYAPGSGKRHAEAPANMLTAMAATAVLCVAIGVYPQALYELLPYPVAYNSYTGEHVVTQLQLLMFTALAYVVLARAGVHLRPARSLDLDVDWFYRRPGYEIATALGRWAALVWNGLAGTAVRGAEAFVEGIRRYHGPEGVLARSWPTGAMAFWTTVMLAAYLVLSYL